MLPLVGDIFLEAPANQLFDQLKVLNHLFDVLNEGFSVPYLRILLRFPQIPLLEYVAIAKALFEASVQNLNKFGPLHENFVLKAFRKQSFDLTCYFCVSESIQDLIFCLKAMYYR